MMPDFFTWGEDPNAPVVAVRAMQPRLGYVGMTIRGFRMIPFLLALWR